ncbi:hypothetical protein H9P43_001021 [Blastocladiella emersonii ATCC 22665]|nr:hypothetical protein H9P43_001021 [Blastocladiella emersonii ATCC 22665]
MHNVNFAGASVNAALHHAPAANFSFNQHALALLEESTPRPPLPPPELTHLAVVPATAVAAPADPTQYQYYSLVAPPHAEPQHHHHIQQQQLQYDPQQQQQQQPMPPPPPPQHMQPRLSSDSTGTGTGTGRLGTGGPGSSLGPPSLSPENSVPPSSSLFQHYHQHQQHQFHAPGSATPATSARGSSIASLPPPLSAGLRGLMLTSPTPGPAALARQESMDSDGVMSAIADLADLFGPDGDDASAPPVPPLPAGMRSQQPIRIAPAPNGLYACPVMGCGGYFESIPTLQVHLITHAQALTADPAATAAAVAPPAPAVSGPAGAAAGAAPAKRPAPPLASVDIVTPSFAPDTSDKDKEGRAFACTHCARAFKRRADCTRHERSHFRERPFACNACDKRWTRKEGLVKHLRENPACKPVHDEAEATGAAFASPPTSAPPLTPAEPASTQLPTPILIAPAPAKPPAPPGTFPLPSPLHTPPVDPRSVPGTPREGAPEPETSSSSSALHTRRAAHRRLQISVPGSGIASGPASSVASPVPLGSDPLSQPGSMDAATRPLPTPTTSTAPPHARLASTAGKDVAGNPPPRKRAHRGPGAGDADDDEDDDALGGGGGGDSARRPFSDFSNVPYGGGPAPRSHGSARHSSHRRTPSNSSTLLAEKLMTRATIPNKTIQKQQPAAAPPAEGSKRAMLEFPIMQLMGRSSMVGGPGMFIPAYAVDDNPSKVSSSSASKTKRRSRATGDAGGVGGDNANGSAPSQTSSFASTLFSDLFGATYGGSASGTPNPGLRTVSAAAAEVRMQPTPMSSDLGATGSVPTNFGHVPGFMSVPGTTPQQHYQQQQHQANTPPLSHPSPGTSTVAVSASMSMSMSMSSIPLTAAGSGAGNGLLSVDHAWKSRIPSQLSATSSLVMSPTLCEFGDDALVPPLPPPPAAHLVEAAAAASAAAAANGSYHGMPTIVQGHFPPSTAASGPAPVVMQQPQSQQQPIQPVSQQQQQIQLPPMLQQCQSKTGFAPMPPQFMVSGPSPPQQQQQQQQVSYGFHPAPQSIQSQSQPSQQQQFQQPSQSQPQSQQQQQQQSSWTFVPAPPPPLLDSLPPGQHQPPPPPGAPPGGVWIPLPPGMLPPMHSGSVVVVNGPPPTNLAGGPPLAPQQQQQQQYSSQFSAMGPAYLHG